MMNRALEEFNSVLRRLQNEGVSRQDKELLQSMLSATKQIMNGLEDEMRRIRSVQNLMGESRSFNRCQDSFQMVTNAKRREIEAWETVQATIKRLMY